MGRVTAVGDGVTEWQVGDRAGVTWLAGSDGTCDYCLSGRENLCPNATFTGWDRDGGYADVMTVRADVAVRLPDAYADADAAPLLCGGVIGHRALRLAGVPGLADDPDLEWHRSGPFRLGLYGFGASASLAIQEAIHLGCVVHVATRSAAERERALELGAATVGGYAEPPAEPLDAAISFAPVGTVAVFALGDVAPGGTVVINAIHLDQVPAFPYRLLWEERVLRSVANVTHHDAVEYLELAAAIPVRTSIRTVWPDRCQCRARRPGGGHHRCRSRRPPTGLALPSLGRPVSPRSGSPARRSTRRRLLSRPPARPLSKPAPPGAWCRLARRREQPSHRQPPG